MEEKKTICLAMIVKNESKVIERCFNSVKRLINYWVICDTGSVDGTQDIIKEYWKKKGIEGELYQHDWRNFGYNRTLLMNLAKGKCDYIITLDADEVFEFEPDFQLPYLDKDMYFIWSIINTIYYQRLQLVSDKFNWCYKGVCHEYLIHQEDTNKPITQDVLQKIVNIPTQDGFRSSDPNKYKRDVLVFEMALLDEPDNARYIYYLGQCYRDSKDYDNAIKYYKKRVEIAPKCNSEETYYAQYQIAICKLSKNETFENCAGDLLKAYNIRPSRLEAAYTFIKLCRINNLTYLGYQTFKHILEKDNLETNDTTFVQPDIYKYTFFNELALLACGAGLFQDAYKIFQRILNEKKYPPDFEHNLLHNHTTLKTLLKIN
jgi:glycosyltransferase involved in cell wall biosynthesis